MFHYDKTDKQVFPFTFDAMYKHVGSSWTWLREEIVAFRIATEMTYMNLYVCLWYNKANVYTTPTTSFLDDAKPDILSLSIRIRGMSITWHHLEVMHTTKCDHMCLPQIEKGGINSTHVSTTIMVLNNFYQLTLITACIDQGNTCLICWKFADQIWFKKTIIIRKQTKLTISDLTCCLVTSLCWQ